jgi:hypothetical protein
VWSRRRMRTAGMSRSGRVPASVHGSRSSRIAWYSSVNNQKNEGNK